MGQSTKTDNANPSAKLALRRYFIETYHSKEKPIRVLDCCQGEGTIWTGLKKEYHIQSWGLDVKPRPGRLRIDSARVIEAGGWSETVIDIDTYGSPWKHWLGVLAVCKHPVTVFLTIGMVKIGGGNFDHALLDVFGITFNRLKLPNSIGARLTDLAIASSLHAPSAHGLKLGEVVEALNPGGNARYLGIRLNK